MAFLSGLLAFLTEFFKNLPLISSWFTKTCAQAADDIAKQNAADQQEEEKTGHPV